MLAALKYLLKRGGIENNNESIDSFFENGYSFPQLIATIFQVDQIPNITKTPHSEYFKNKNNEIALQFLFEKNSTIAELNPNFQTENDRINLINLIITRQCFKINTEDIIKQCNKLLKSFDIKCESLDDIMKPTFLTTLLSVLTDDSITKDTNLDRDNFDIIINSFEKAKVPLILNQDSFNIENPDIYLIQIQIIFDIFSEKIKTFSEKPIEIDVSEKVDEITKFNTSIEIINDDGSEIDEEGKKIFPPEDFWSEKNSHDQFITNRDYGSKDLSPMETFEAESLLLTIGYIAEMLNICPRQQCTSFEFTLFNNFIPLFVMRFLNIERIPNLKKIECEPEKEPLIHQEITNIKIVIDYLKNSSEKKDPKFDLLIFDFDQPYLFVNSAKLFFTTFLNTHFIRYTRVEMMERCHILLGDLKWYSKKKLYSERQYDIFAGLLLFIQLAKREKNKDKTINEETDKVIETDNVISLDEIIKNLRSDDNNFCTYFNDFSALYQQAGIPRVIGIDIIDEFYHDSDLPDSIYYQQSDKDIPNSIMYQLQFIFDILDSFKFLRVVELLKLQKSKLKKVMKIADLIDKIMPSVKSKIQFFKMKGKIKKIDMNELKEMKHSTLNADQIKPQNFNDRQNSESEIKKLPKIGLKEETKEQTTKETDINDDAVKFWNPIEANFSVENGIFYSKEEPKQKSTDFYNQMREVDEKICKKMNFKKEKTVRKKTLKPEATQEEQPIPLSSQIQVRSSTYSFITKLYKFLFFDETKLEWVFDSDLFNNFASDKKINIEGSRTPLIFYFNSNEDDLVKINSHFIMGSYPSLVQSQIYVYPLCEKQLSKINTTIDFANTEKMLVKPIFLVLHVPKDKQNQSFVHIAITQLYIFLSKICDVSICIYNETFIKHQIETLDDALTVSSHAYNIKNDKLNIIFLKNNPNAEYKYDYDQQVHQLSVLKNERGQNIQYYLANFENFDSYKPFLDHLIDISLQTKTTFSDVQNYFNDFNLSQLSGMYINIISTNQWKDELKRVIENRFQMLKSRDSDFENNPEIVLSKLHQEFTSFSPITDKEFRNECSTNYSLMRKTFTKVNNNIVVEELRKSSDKNLEILQKFLTDENYWTKNQIENMINGNTRFLKKEYFSIIKAITDPKLFPLVYQDNKDILDSQIKESNQKITQFAQPILDQFKNKNKVKNVNAEESSKKGTNYTLKETENLRELKIEVKTVDKLESVIEQDF